MTERMCSTISTVKMEIKRRERLPFAQTMIWCYCRAVHSVAVESGVGPGAGSGKGCAWGRRAQLGETGANPADSEASKGEGADICAPVQGDVDQQ